VSNSAAPTSPPARHAWLWVVLLLLLGAVLRADGLGRMTAAGLLHYDEAFYGADAMSLLSNPRLVPFFAENNGRESGWMYLLLPMMATLGATDFAMRVTQFFLAMLLLAAVYRLAAQVLGGRAALWAMAGLAVLYWPVQAAHIAFRGNMYPLWAALAAWAFVRAWPRNTVRAWALCGVLLGALAYTYFSARAVLAYHYGFLALVVACGVLTLWIAQRNALTRFVHTLASRARGAALALAVGLLLTAPLAVYTAQNPALSLGRIEDQARLSPSDLLENAGLWAIAWLWQGDPQVILNQPLRPIFDLPLAVLAVAGCVALVALWRRDSGRDSGRGSARGGLLWWAGYALFAVVPSLVSTYAPHSLRAGALLLSIALLLGAGGAWLETQLAALLARVPNMAQRARPMAMGVLVVLCLWAAGNTYAAWQAWFDNQLFTVMETHINRNGRYIADQQRDDAPVYFVPFKHDHPNVLLWTYRFSGYSDGIIKHVGAFAADQCVILQQRRALYAISTAFAPSAADTLRQWADVSPLMVSDEGFAVYEATARPIPTSAEYTFGAGLSVGLIDPLPTVVRAGDTLTLRLRLQARIAAAANYTAFVHLFTPPYSAETMRAQTDAPLCPPYPTLKWAADEIIVQTLTLTLPPAAADQTYTLVLGLYDSQTLARVPLTLGGDTATLGTLTVRP
jgi:hypothetical protein